MGDGSGMVPGAQKEPVTDGTPLRPLGATEDIYYRFDSASPIYFGVISRFSGPLEFESIKKAWDAVRKRHPLLRACIVENPHNVPWFVTSDADMSLEMRQAPYDDAWKELEDSLVRRFDTDRGPLVRCVVLEHGDNDFSLVTTYHHAISDGRSSQFVTRDLLTSLSQLSQGQEPDLETLPLMDYMGDRIHTLQSYNSMQHLARTIAKTISGSWRFLWRGAGLPILPKGCSKLSKQTLLIEPREVSPSDMKHVLKRAKEEGVTVQCTLNAALTMACAERLRFSRFKSIPCTQILDVRSRLIPPVGEDCGLFIGGNTSIHRVGRNKDFWQFTREIRQGLQTALETPLPFFHPATHEFYSKIGKAVGYDHAEAFSKMISHLHPEGLTVSNLGRIQMDVPDCPLHLTGFAFATNTNVLNSFNTSAASCEGKLVWSFSGSSIIDREILSKVADRSVELLLENSLPSSSSDSGPSPSPSPGKVSDDDDDPCSPSPGPSPDKGSDDDDDDSPSGSPDKGSSSLDSGPSSSPGKGSGDLEESAS